MTAAGFSLAGPAAACPGGAGTNVSKKSEPMGPTGTPLDGQLLTSEYGWIGLKDQRTVAL